MNILFLDASVVENEEISTKKHAGYEKDDDFNTSKNKNDDEFAPDVER